MQSYRRVKRHLVVGFWAPSDDLRLCPECTAKGLKDDQFQEVPVLAKRSPLFKFTSKAAAEFWLPPMRDHGERRLGTIRGRHVPDGFYCDECARLVEP